jgi:hypothetical protein
MSRRGHGIHRLKKQKKRFDKKRLDKRRPSKQEINMLQ